VARSEKVSGLFAELGLPVAGTMEAVSQASIVERVRAAAGGREALTGPLREARERLAGRAALNLSLWEA